MRCPPLSMCAWLSTANRPLGQAKVKCADRFDCLFRRMAHFLLHDWHAPLLAPCFPDGFLELIVCRLNIFTLFRWIYSNGSRFSGRLLTDGNFSIEFPVKKRYASWLMGSEKTIFDSRQTFFLLLLLLLLQWLLSLTPPRVARSQFPA